MSNSPAPLEIPESFFRDAATADRDLPTPAPAGAWQPSKQMYWYDSIIDDFFANPGTTLKECAARLGRSPVTISLIVRSDLFKARYAQRRRSFNDELDLRLVGKLAKVAETALDLTQAVLDKKRDSIPLPLLHEIGTGALDRLGYGVKAAQAAAPSVSVNVNSPSVTVSPDALAAARQRLQSVAERPVVLDAVPVASEVAGPAAVAGEEEG